MHSNQALRSRTTAMAPDAAPPSMMTADGGRRLHAAVARGNIDEVELVLRTYPAAVHWQDDLGNTALHAALLNRSSLALVDALLAGRPNLRTRNRLGDTCIHLGALLGRDAPEIGMRILNNAMREHDLNDDPLHPTPQQTLLMIMTIADDGPIVDLLVAQGIDVNIKGEDGMTALHLAAYAGAIKAAEALLRCRADPDARDSTGMTPMMAAARGGHVEFMRRLRDMGGNINARDDEGRTPLMHACLGDQSTGTIIKIIVAGGIDTISDHAGRTLKVYQRESVARQVASGKSPCVIV
ncbi:ankyrin repeat domain-containing protein [Paracidovorax citrulli]